MATSVGPADVWAHSRWARSRTATDAIIAGVVVAVVCVPVWPGIYTVDSQAILRAAREHRISGWYSPLLGWAWGVLDRIGIGPAAVFLLGVAAFVVAVLALAKQFLPEGLARLVTVGTALFPPVYGLLGWVGRDVWFATAVLGITASAWHVRRHGSAGSPWVLVVLVIMGAVAADSRQNAAPFALLAVGVATHAAIRRFQPQARRLRRAAIIGLAVGLFWAALLGAQRTVITSNLHSEQYAYSRDLVAVSLRIDEPLMDTLLFPSQDLNALSTRLEGLDPEAAVYLDPAIIRYDPADAELTKAWAKQWWRMVREHPVPYLESRAALYGDQVGLSGKARSPYYIGSDDLKWRFGEFSNAFPGLLDWRNRLLAWIHDTPIGSLLYNPLLYIVGSIAAIGALGQWARERRLTALLFLVLAAMQATLFFTAGTHEFRYQYFQVVLSVCLGWIVFALRRRAWSSEQRGDYSWN